MRSTGFEIIPKRDYIWLVARQKVRDAADQQGLAAAKTGKTHAIVTGDADLLSLKESEGVRILTTQEVLKMMRGRHAGGRA